MSVVDKHDCERFYTDCARCGGYFCVLCEPSHANYCEGPADAD